MNERTVDEGFGFSRQFTDTVSEGMMEDERILRNRLKRDQERAARSANPLNQQPPLLQNPPLLPNPYNQNPYNQNPAYGGPVNERPAAE